MSPAVPTTPRVAESDTLREAARALVESACGAVIVTGPLGTVGAVTDRDVVLAVAAGLDPDRLRAADAMQETPRAVGSRDEPTEVARIMVRFGLRHLTVVSDDGQVHLVSSRQVLHGVLEVLEEDKQAESSLEDPVDTERGP